jgi:protein-disulfide isomerase
MSVSSTNDEIATTSTVEHGHARGRADAPVTLEMFGNYECLHCRRLWPAIASMLAERADEVRLVYRHFAHDGDFPHAELAAEAAEAAGAQGAFWEMHDRLMTETPALHEEHLLAAAASLGLDVAAVRAALETHAFRDAVRAQVDDGAARGVRSTPTLYVDGERVDDPWDLHALRRMLTGALAHRPRPAD